MNCYYFAYGSNMDAARMEARKINFGSRFPGQISGFKLAFNKQAKNSNSGYANIVEAHAESIVEGIVYPVDMAEIQKLDVKEGYPDHYTRKLIQVNTPHGNLEAWVYIAQPDKTAENLKPEQSYLDHLLAGKDFLSIPYYKSLHFTETTK